MLMRDASSCYTGVVTKTTEELILVQTRIPSSVYDKLVDLQYEREDISIAATLRFLIKEKLKRGGKK